MTHKRITPRIIERINAKHFERLHPAQATRRPDPLPPLRLIVTRGAGSSVLECGHVITTPSHTDTLRARCPTCLPLKARQRYIELKRIQIAAALMRWRPDRA